MRKKQNRIQLALISIGFLLFVLTYFYYPSLNKDKIEKNDTLAKIDSLKIQLKAFNEVK